MTVGGAQRVCEWCGGPLPVDAPEGKVTCGASCRAFLYRYRHDIRRADGSRVEPPSGSPLAVGGPTISGARAPRANGSDGTRKPSGLQLSYRKAVEVVTRELAPFVEPVRVEAALRTALPDRQRERLEAGR